MSQFKVQLDSKVVGAQLLRPGEPWQRPMTRSAAAPPSETRSVIDHAAVEQMRTDRQLLGQMLARLERQAADLISMQNQRMEELRQASIEIAAAIASRFMRRQIESGDFPFEQMLIEAVGQFHPSAAVAIHMHPLDLKLLRETLNGQPFMMQRDGAMQFVEDPSICRGDCRLDDGELVLLSRFQSQLDRLREDLLRSIQHAAA